MKNWRRFIRPSPYGVRSDGTPIIPEEERQKLLPSGNLSQDAVVSEKPIPDSIKKEVRKILEDAGVAQ